MRQFKRSVIAYLRVSTDKQDLSSQLMTIEAWAKTHNVVIDERLVEEEAISGKEDQRPRF